MAKIVNKSQFSVTVNPAGAISVSLRPGTETTAFTDEQAQEWASRKSNGFIDAGLVLIAYDRNQATPVAPGHLRDLSIAGMHWRKALSAIKECGSLDMLEALLISEERPKVREAIQARMAECAP